MLSAETIALDIPENGAGKPMIGPLILFVLSAVLASEPAAAGQDEAPPLLLGAVTVSDQFVVFSHAGDLWKVGREGGTAEQLTVGPEDDDYPAFSPDGFHVAYSRRSADDWDVYVIQVQGGEPRRLTYNPEADIVRGWSASGDTVLFTSHRDEQSVFRLYTIPSTGVFPTPIPLPRAWDGTFSPSGDRIAYVPFALPAEFLQTEWRRYRGGMVSAISIVNLETGDSETIRREDSTDRDPMWVGNDIYFVSDRSGTFNIHRYDPSTRRVEQVTKFEDFGVESAASAGGAMAFVRDGRIHLLNPATGEDRLLDVRVRPDRSELQPRTVRGADYIETASVSAGGDPVIFGMRGDVVAYQPAAGGYTNLTGTSGAAERYPALSPDGQWIAYFSDESGEYQLHVAPASGEGSIKKIPIELKPTFYRELTWSHDSKRLAFSDNELTLWVVDIETLGARRVTTSEYANQDRFQPSWSPDGTLLAYSRFESNRLRAIHLYDITTGRKVQVTDGSVSAEHPTFDKSGRYLYFIASNTSLLGEPAWSVLSGELFRPLITRRLNAVVLREGFPAPVLPATGQPNPRLDSLAAPRGPQPREGGERPLAPPGRRPDPSGGPGQTVVSVGGLTRRTVPLPLPAADYAALATAAAPGLLYVLVNEWPPAPATGDPKQVLYRYDISKPRELDKLVEDLDEFHVSADGETVLYRRDDAWHLVSGAAGGVQPEASLDLSDIELEVDPAAEWRQIYAEAWRLLDDYFYDPNHHGLNIRQMADHYAAYLPSITRRQDLNALLRKALGNVSVSHLTVRGGDIPSPPDTASRIGLLGADFQLDQGLYRITRVLPSGHYNLGNPLLQAPLDQPGVFVEPGDYVLAVDGTRITARANLYSFFAGKALTPVRLTVADNAAGEDSRTYTIVPLPGENTLRRWAWAERNRRTVAEESQGILGYVYVPNFGAAGLEAVMQQLLAYSDERGLIIDQRFAPGGITADYLIEWLRRAPLYYYAFRHGDDLPVPTNPLPANKVLLINDVNGSAAETFAFMFKLGNVGRIVGTRTMGAGIGPSGFIPTFIDGGRVSIPNRAAYNPAGTWDIENHGVEPDIAVPFSPADWWEGRDPQLGTAIRTVLEMIVDNPPLEVTRPDYPVHQ
jgi:tricorn protease